MHFNMLERHKYIIRYGTEHSQQKKPQILIYAAYSLTLCQVTYPCRYDTCIEIHYIYFFRQVPANVVCITDEVIEPQISAATLIWPSGAQHFLLDQLPVKFTEKCSAAVKDYRKCLIPVCISYIKIQNLASRNNIFYEILNIDVLIYFFVNDTSS